MVSRSTACFSVLLNRRSAIAANSPDQLSLSAMERPTSYLGIDSMKICIAEGWRVDPLDTFALTRRFGAWYSALGGAAIRVGPMSDLRRLASTHEILESQWPLADILNARL